MADLIYPSNIELQAVAQQLMPRLTADRPIFEVLPLRAVDSHILEWEQMDNFIGLQQVRGLNGMPSRVKQIGGKRYLMTPGVYGEFAMLDEQQLTIRRPWGAFTSGVGGAIDVGDLILEKQNQLLQRRIDRIEQIGWTLLATGTFSVSDGASVLHTDSYTFQTFAAGTAWATVATSTPLADFRAVQLKSRGLSVDFGAGSKAYMNRTTFNSLLSNTNANDFGGRKGNFGASINGPVGVNQVMAADDLPEIVIYDMGYIDDSNVFQLYVPNNKVVVVGRRPSGQPVGEYRFTRNSNNPDFAPGPYMMTIREERPPMSIEVHDGHSGGPVLYQPSSIVVMTV
jgi:hypothetical protein